MPSARELELVVVDAKTARACIENWHYSGKCVANSLVHFAVKFNGRIGGVLSYGSPMDKRKVLGLVKGTQWDGMMELNRMALGPALPKNSESRSLAISVRLLKARYPQLEWLLSFADGVQCGDGAIYRAAGWKLTGIKKSDQIWRDTSGRIWTRMSVTEAGSKSREEALRSVDAYGLEMHRASTMRPFIQAGWTCLDGYMFRYILPLKTGILERLTVPTIPYSKIDEVGGRMYRGNRLASIVDAPRDQRGDGVESTARLHND